MKVLLYQTRQGQADSVLEALVDSGHDVRTAAGAAAMTGTSGMDAAAWAPECVVAQLDQDSAATLDGVERLVRGRAWTACRVLFTGGNELAITAARRRFPDADFARADLVATAVASLEADE